MEKIKSTAVLSEWVKTINELIEINNENQCLLNSFKNNMQDPIQIEVANTQLNNSYIIDIKVTGEYRITLNGTGAVQVLINESGDLNYYRHELKDNANEKLLLTHGDKVMVSGTGIPSNTKLTLVLERSILQSFYNYVKSESERINALANMTTQLESYSRELQTVNNLKAEFTEGIRLLDQVNTNISSLSSRVTTLENK